MSDFTNLTTTGHLAQLIISGDPNTVYVDNVYFSSISTSVDEEVEFSNYTLENNYPNPFKPQTTISFSLVQPSKVSIEIYNLKGQLVKTLADGEFGAARHSFVWNGTDNSGKRVSDGVYFYKMQTPKFSSTKKMILLK
ncbi:MAG: T9SS type A sorting domain-containing protein [Candidatus Cloacimonetes bacterium]|nr:T9SS type A sorting domain-containing protein [Candidatus Cloacimonadota bacterium]